MGESATNTKKIEKILNSSVNNIDQEIIFPKTVKENQKIFKLLKKSFKSVNNSNKLKSFFKYFK